MNISSEDIVVNSCQYAPIYLIQDPGAGAIQANAYVITPSNLDQRNPIPNNLKTFYESSGNIDNDLISASNLVKPTILKKRDGGQVGNNLKLASFLLPKSENVNKQYVMNNIVLKPTTTVNNTCTVNTTPKIDMNRKIVKIKDVPAFNRKGPEKIVPKIKPKKNAPSLISNTSKYTSVQLIKLGETYHSLNKLSDEQMKMVNQALKIFDDPSNTTPEPAYDPVTNTQYIYKVVSPKDLAVVGNRKIMNTVKVHPIVPKPDEEREIQAKPANKHEEMEIQKPIKKIEEREIHTKPAKKLEDKVSKHIHKETEEQELVAEAKVTRSGRKVKLPKQISPESSPHKSKRRTETIVSCFQCSTDFTSLYRLQKHYQYHPTHIPTKIHSNLFHCLLAIIKGGSEEDRTNIFIQQLEQLIVKLKSLLPCLLKKVDGTEGQPCTVNDDIGRLFGMNPGKYNIDVDALHCVKDKNGYCIHNPPKVEPLKKELKNNLAPHTSTDHLNDTDTETENCARINSVAKWPTVSKRIWKLKQRKQDLNAKKIRLHSECLNESINVSDVDELTIGGESVASTIAPHTDVTNEVQNNAQCNIICQPMITDTNNIGEHSKIQKNHVQFHSAHFDIRSSPIKSSSTVFRKFQIDPSKLANYEAQVIRTLGIGEDKGLEPTLPPQDNDNNFNDIFKHDDVGLTCKDSNIIDHELKEWIMSTSEKSQDSFTKSLIEPALIHLADDKTIGNKNELTETDGAVTTETDNLSNQTESVLNFLEELGKDLAYPETEIRNSSVDFQLDLFTFNNN